MPLKSLEQYERELMQMYRMALAKDPNYAALVRQQNAKPSPDDVVQEEEIEQVIPAPGIEEAVPLPPAFLLLEEEDEDEPDMPAAAPPEMAQPAMTEPAVAVVLPRAEAMLPPDTQPQNQPQAPEKTEPQKPAEAKEAPAAKPDAQPEPKPETEPEPKAETPTRPSRDERPAPPETQRKQIPAIPNMGAGNLIVNVTAQGRTMPVEGAEVTVSFFESGERKVAAKATTDSSGKTEPIRLPAPIREFPIYPQQVTGDDLSADYLVMVEATGYESVSDEEISIFDGVTSVKRIDLTAVEDTATLAIQAETKGLNAI